MRRSETKNFTAIILAFAILLGLNLLVMPRNISAAGTDTTEAVQLNVNTTLADNLAALKGKSVTITLSSGQPITGMVTDVKGNLLHLGKISQKEFFDALIAIDHISAIETRVR